MNITIDDTSPQIVYQSKGKSTPGVWQTLHPPDDWTSFCFDNSFHSSSTEGDSATLTFNGSAITVYGSKRLAHGPFTAELDGGAPLNLTTKAIFKQEDVQQVIYQADGLDESKEHTLVLTNRPLYNRPPPRDNELLWFDIDYVVLTSSPSGEIYTFTYDDTDPHFTFSDGSWSKYENSTGRHNETSSMSSETDSWFELEFRGSSVQLFGSINLDHSNYTVTLDGRDLGEFYGGYHMWFATCLFTASGLPEGQHVLRVTNKDSTADKKTFIEVDYAVVNSTISESQQTEATSSTTSSTGSARAGVDWAQTYSPSTSQVVNTAAPLVTASGDTTATSSNNVSLIGIIAGVVSALVLLSISVVGIHMYRRKRRLARSNHLAAGLRPGEAWEKSRVISRRDGRGGRERIAVASTPTTSFKSWAW